LLPSPPQGLFFSIFRASIRVNNLKAFITEQPTNITQQLITKIQAKANCLIYYYITMSL
jgi:hypothetical protein